MKAHFEVNGAFTLIVAFLAVVLISSVAFAVSAKVDSATTLEELKTMSTQGNADAMLELGERLIQGTGVDKNVDDGFKWLQKAADAGKSQAWYDMGYVYSNGFMGDADLPAAMKYFRSGADKGNADCQFSLGLIYQAGKRIPGGVDEDPVAAVKWYRLAAEQGQPEATFHLGQIYFNGWGVKADSVEAVKWYRKGSEVGNPETMWFLGVAYEKGAGVKRDPVQAYALVVAAMSGIDNPEHQQEMIEKRDLLRMDLNPDQLKQAEKLSLEWQAKIKK